MNFFILTSALVVAVVIFLAWYNWRLKGKLACTEYELDMSQMEVRALEHEFKQIETVPMMVHGKCDMDRWRAVIANACANVDTPANRIAWGKEFEDHLRRNAARKELEAPTAFQGGGQIEGDGPPIVRQNTIERAVEEDDKKKSKKK